MPTDELKISELAELLDHLAFLNGPHGSMRDWKALVKSLTEGLQKHALALRFDVAEREYVVYSVFSKVGD